MKLGLIIISNHLQICSTNVASVFASFLISTIFLMVFLFLFLSFPHFSFYFFFFLSPISPFILFYFLSLFIFFYICIKISNIIFKVTPTGTLYLFIDLKKYLKGDKPDDEMALFDDLIDKARVYLTPGTLFHSRVAGYFRVCYATPGPEEELMEGLERLVTFLGAWQSVFCEYKKMLCFYLRTIHAFSVSFLSPKRTWLMTPEPRQTITHKMVVNFRTVCPLQSNANLAVKRNK